MKKILIQLDTDAQPSSFDRVVAVDSDVDELFSYGKSAPETVEGLVHGAIFTRGPKDLKNTALFIGGSHVAAGEALLEKVQSVFFGPMSVSVMMDSNGSNTTAAAAVLCALKHLEAGTTTAAILGGTGPVGHRAAQLLSNLGATVRLVSRSKDRAAEACDAIGGGNLEPVGASDEAGIKEACLGSDLVLAAGAAGVQFLSESVRDAIAAKVLIDVNAVPPVGIEGVGVMDSAADVGNSIAYGAIGVGGLKMKIHKACVRKLFTANNLVLDTNAIFELGRELV
ncbi:MAG: NADP-dependent methylenetetrahydromethanopterin/methylenetetrahydrofolate dehydrogenase [Planctomycetaceae bacterium]